MKIQNLITEKRKEKHLSMMKLAEIVGVSQSTITRWERGEIQSIKNDKIVALANALGVTPGEILDMPMAEQVSFEEQQILSKLRLLSGSDKEEILAIIDFKLSRIKK